MNHFTPFHYERGNGTKWFPDVFLSLRYLAYQCAFIGGYSKAALNIGLCTRILKYFRAQINSRLTSRVLSCLMREKIYYYGSCTRSVSVVEWLGHCGRVTAPFVAQDLHKKFLHATIWLLSASSIVMSYVPTHTVCLITRLDTLGQREYRSMGDLDRNHGCPISRSTIQFPAESRSRKWGNLPEHTALCLISWL